MKHLIHSKQKVNLPFSFSAIFKLAKPILLSVLIMSFTIICKSQSTVVAVQSGPWNDAATWDVGIPGSLDDVIIGNGISVEVNSSGEACNSLLVGTGDGAGSGAIFFTGASSLTVTGDITLGEAGGATGSITMDESATLTCSTIIEGDPGYSGIFETNMGTIVFNGSFTLPYNMFQFKNLTINSGTVTTGGRNLPIEGDLTINSGATLDLGINTANRNTIAGTFTVNNGGTLRIGGGGTIPANFSTHVVGPTSTIEYYGVAQTVATLNSGQNYGYLIISGSGLKEVNGSIGIARDLTINGGIFSVNTFTANRTTAGGTLTVSNGASLRIGGSGTIPSNFSTHVIGAASTIEYVGTSAQNVAVLNSGQNYGNLTLTSSVKTLLGSTTVRGTIAFAGTPNKLIIGNNTLTLEGAITGSLTGSRNFSGSSGSNLIVKGAFNRTLFFDASTPGTTNVLNGLTINHNGNVSTLGNSVIINGNLTFTAGKVAIGSSTLTVKGDFVNTVPDALRGSSNGNLVVNGSVSPVLSMDQTTPGTTNALGSLQINSSGQVITMANNLQINNTTTFTAGKLYINRNTLTLKGSVVNTVPGGIRGDSASNLVINGIVSPTLSFDQTNPGITNILNNFTINSSGQTVTLSNALRLLGTHTPVAGILASGGNYTITSSASSTANIAAGDINGGYITGDVAVERYIPKNTNRAWRLLASPTNGQTIKQAWQENLDAGENGVPGYGTNITSNSSAWQANGFDYWTQNPSMYTYNQTTDNLGAVNSTNISIGNEPGYFIYIRGGRNITPSSSILAGSSTVLRTKGTLYTGNQPATVVPADKSALIGNPYASAIDLRNVATSGGCTGTSFYVWDPKLLGSYSLGAYQTLTPSAGNYIVIPGGGSYGTLGSVTNTIQSGAAFFVQATGGEGTVTINESSKASGSGMVFRPLGTNDDSKLVTTLYAVSGNNKELADGNVIFFDENYIDAIDGYDSRKMTNFGENFSMMKGGTQLIVERRTLPTKNDTVQFAMYYMKKMSYQIKMSASKLQQTGMLVLLEDKYLKSFTPVNLGDTTNYTFSVDANAGSSASDRFRIVMKPAVVLPVTITAVKAYEQSGKIAVEWQVSNQINIREYQVEKSLNGKDFSLAGKVAAAVINSAAIFYSWLDAAPVQGANYYRIKSVGTDGSAKYTQVIKVMTGKLAPAFAVSPHPVKGSMMNLQLVNQPKGNYHIRLINNSGQLVFKQTVMHTGGSAAQSISLPSELSKGYYQLEIITPGATSTIQSLIISN